MNIMAKKLISYGSVLLLTASLAGCSSPFAGGAGSTETPVNTTAEEASREDSSAESSTTPASEDTASSEKDIILTTYYYSAKKDDIERCTGHYTDITFSRDLEKKYPKLAETVNILTSDWESYVKSEVEDFAYWYDEEYSFDITFYNDQSIEIVRFDDRLFTVLQNDESYGGGVHPNHSTSSYNIDPVTGITYNLRDVLAKPEDFPAVIREKLEKENYSLLEEIDSFHYADGDVFTDKLENDTYTFTVDDKGLHIIFSPYEVASYAAGTIIVDFSYDEYPDLITEAFKMTAPVDLESRIIRSDGGTTDLKAQSSYSPEESDEEDDHDDAIEVVNPTWSYYFDDSFKKDIESHYLTLTQTKEERSDWLDTEVWASDHGFTLQEFPYDDESYHYEAYNPYMYGYMYNSLVISEVGSGNIIGDYNLARVCNGYDEKEVRSSDQTEFIRYAKIVDDILYVEIGHMGYASEGPDNAYIVAIDMKTNKMIFRSEPLMANGNNFKIVDDTIICGYGFTAEPDYIYLLDRYTGKMVQQIPVRSAPYVFELVGDTLYVATYNTAYEFTMTR